MTNAQHGAALAYVRRIHNTHKQAYARAWLAYVSGGRRGPEPDRGILGPMAAQAVRMQLDGIMGGNV